MTKGKFSHQCVICGINYESCDLCKDIQTYTPYRALCDTSKHYQVYLIISSLRGKVMNDDEAREALERLKVTEKEIKTFLPAVQELLLPIMAEVVEKDEYVEIPTEKKYRKK